MELEAQPKPHIEARLVRVVTEEAGVIAVGGVEEVVALHAELQGLAAAELNLHARCGAQEEVAGRRGSEVGFVVGVALPKDVLPRDFDEPVAQGACVWRGASQSSTEPVCGG